MGLTLTVEGQDVIELGVNEIESVWYKTDTPDDFEFGFQLGALIEIIGKFPVNDGLEDETVKLAQWGILPVQNTDCYRKVTVEIVNAGQTVRKYYLPNAFVIDYRELLSINFYFRAV